MKYNLFLDDIRIPNDILYYKINPFYKKRKWVIVKSYDEFVNYINKYGLPNLISYDHDLADIQYVANYDEYIEKTRYDALKWVCNYCLDNKLKIPIMVFHTANIIGEKNMKTYYNNFKKFNPDLI